MPDPLTLAPVKALREMLTDLGLRNAENPGQLTPPGVLVQVTGFERDTLAGFRITTRLLCVVPSSSHEQASEELVGIVNQLLTVLEPDGPIAAASVVLPNDPAPLPALSVPLNLYS